jgi:hypothetical protein
MLIETKPIFPSAAGLPVASSGAIFAVSATAAI